MPDQKKQRKPKGKPLPLDDQALDMASLITPQDIEAAKIHAAEHGSKRFNELLEAAKPDAV